MGKFVVISTQRTGSTLLIKLLDSHPEVLCAGEIFFPPSGSEYAIRKYVEQSSGRKLRHQLFRSGLVWEFLDDLYAQEGYGAIGFKYMYSQARHIPRCYPSVLRYILENEIPVIHGVRKNALRVVLSRLASKASGVYRSSAPVESRPIHVPAKTLKRELSRLREADIKWENRLSGLPYLQVDYESLVSNREREERRLLGFIGVEYQGALTTPFQKVGANSLQAMIENYAEVERVLKGTEFECFLADERH